MERRYVACVTREKVIPKPGQERHKGIESHRTKEEFRVVDFKVTKNFSHAKGQILRKGNEFGGVETGASVKRIIKAENSGIKEDICSTYQKKINFRFWSKLPILK